MKESEFKLNNISKYRNELFGISILLIIIFHFTENYYTAFKSGAIIKTSQIFQWIVLKYYKGIGSIGVEIFLFLSGMGLYYSFTKNNNITDFYKKRYKRILIPYAQAGIIFWIIKDLIISKLGFKRFIKDITFITFFSRGTITLWFILILIILYFIFPIIYKLITRKNSLINFSAIILTAIIFPYAVYFVSPKLSSNISILTTRIPIFILGTYLAKYIKNNLKIDKRICIIIIIFGFLSKIICIKCGLLPITNKYLNIIYALALILLFVYILDSIKSQSISHTFTKIGQYSLELYISHVTLRNLLKSIGIPLYQWEKYILMIFISIIYALILNKTTELINESIQKP